MSRVTGIEAEKMYLWIKWCSRSLYKRVNHELSKLKGIVSAIDNTLFLWQDRTGNLMGILAMQVDDFIFNGNDTFQENVISELKTIFQVGAHKNGTFKFWVLGVKQRKDGITTDQHLYASFTFPIVIKKGTSLRKNDELSQEEKTVLKRLTGPIMWVATQTPLEVSFDVCRISNTGNLQK